MNSYLTGKPLLSLPLFSFSKENNTETDAGITSLFFVVINSTLQWYGSIRLIIPRHVTNTEVTKDKENKFFSPVVVIGKENKVELTSQMLT